MKVNETFELNNGVKIPVFGLGTWFIDDDKVDQAIIEATRLGIRHFDTAQAYGNEVGVGKGIKECGISRDQLFITTKVAAEHKDYASAKESVLESLKKLDLDYIDLVIIHAPQPWNSFREGHYFKENKEVWKALEDLYEEGKVKAIGVSNFLIEDLKNILEDCKIKPMVNQILTHISNTPLELIEFCKENNIVLEAYSPIAHGEALKNESIVQMAKKYNVTPAQLCIQYVIQLGMVALPKTANPKHMKDNIQLDFTISQEDMDTLIHMKKIKDYGEYTAFPVFSGK